GERPSSSQIYPFLSKLEDEGLVEVDETGERRKKVYKLTDEGDAYVETKLEMFSDIITETLEKNLTTCAHCGCKVYEGGHTEEVDGEELKFCCKHCAESYQA
ncbi:MAG: PadR family transcriptional regulator, partial [Candidatus Aenigmatarchaeota archaeon]